MVQNLVFLLKYFELKSSLVNRILSALFYLWRPTYIKLSWTHFPPQDREFVELEVPYNGQAKRPGSPSPLLSPSHSVISTANIFQSCCGRCCGQRYQVRTHRGLGNKLHPIVSWTEWAINLNMYSSFENGYLQQFLNRWERGVRYSQY